MKDWIYETGREESEILGSGSNYSYIFTTRNLEEAMIERKKLGRNYLSRWKYEEGKRIYENFYDNEWIKS